MKFKELINETNTTSEDMYKVRKKQISKLLSDLNSLLTKKDKAFSKDSKNYGYAGDLAYVQEQLEEIVKFLKG